MDSSVREHNDDVRCADAVSSGGDELLCPGHLKRVGQVADEASSCVVLDVRHGPRHLVSIEVVAVEVELVAGGR